MNPQFQPVPHLSRVLRWRGALALSLSLLSAAALADAVQIQSSPTSLISTADRMISYRCQNHMWLSADGAIHVMINRGPGLNGQSLALFSSFDNGVTWVNSGVTLPGSNGSTTSDGYYADGKLYMTYDVGTGSIKYAELAYDAAQKKWSLATSTTVYTSNVSAALTPAMAVDSMGRQWLTFTHQDKATGNYSIKMMRKAVTETTWVDTGFVFGAVDNVSDERSGRPIATSRGMGVVFTVHADTYWAERDDGWALSAKWPRALISTKTQPLNDPYGTHFSIVADSAFNMHLVHVDGGTVLYSRYLTSQRKWVTRQLTTNPDQRSSYVQATVVNDQPTLIFNSLANLSVYQSTDGGDNFVRSYALVHPQPTGTQDFSRPRMESPGVSTSPIPVLQQYMDGSRQKAVFFAVPGSPAP